MKIFDILNNHYSRSDQHPELRSYISTPGIVIIFSRFASHLLYRIAECLYCFWKILAIYILWMILHATSTWYSAVILPVIRLCQVVVSWSYHKIIHHLREGIALHLLKPLTFIYCKIKSTTRVQTSNFLERVRMVISIALLIFLECSKKKCSCKNWEDFSLKNDKLDKGITCCCTYVRSGCKIHIPGQPVSEMELLKLAEQITCSTKELSALPSPIPKTLWNTVTKNAQYRHLHLIKNSAGFCSELSILSSRKLTANTQKPGHANLLKSRKCSKSSISLRRLTLLKRLIRMKYFTERQFLAKRGKLRNPCTDEVDTSRAKMEAGTRTDLPLHPAVPTDFSTEKIWACNMKCISARFWENLSQCGGYVLRRIVWRLYSRRARSIIWINFWKVGASTPSVPFKWFSA